MTFTIIDNMPAPEPTPRTRKPGEFSIALNSLEIGQGFQFQSKGTVKSNYPKISSKKFGGKRFKLWMIAEGEGGEMNTLGVRRENDKVVADAAPGVNTVDGGEDE